MNDDDGSEQHEHPELAGYEPHDAARPLRSRRMLLVMRLAVLLGLVALIVPGILTSLQIASVTAASACSVAVAHYYPLAEGSTARFDLAGPGGFGWQCYAIDVHERETWVIALGLIPRAPGFGPSVVPA
ncbi:MULTISPECIES: hypothetical protein [unclassified Cryobacterium]|uniref:hypothetical protein n=1 Tax=unclassified Cryobacterium TaxID=2649013 RepID=UPI002AB46851|nr:MULTISPECIES: hypothetical protein [unclassified Cryobacterium]MDY7543014.1 hypothetical protein [Cryobacterium sp. 5B3]MEB0000381.1 hypothetical protein [Cryobacterium sp. RTS3]MEB0266095.1 hypothetical protein [Cryobacterium sp. 10I5]MEB0274043.1 hypothetical protein [Cryobacterium sp. 5B3]